MELTDFRHKGLWRLYHDDDVRGIATAVAERLRRLLLALETAERLEDLNRFPGWRLHPLKGDLSGYWSLTVTGNLRLIFRYDGESNTASHLDLVDYHWEALCR